MSVATEVGPISVRPEVGIYVDDAPRLVLPQLHRLAEGGDLAFLDRLRVMVDGTKPGIDEDQRWLAQHLAELRDVLDSCGREDVAITVVVWASPQRDFIEDVRHQLPDLLDAAHADSAEGDFEGAGTWKTTGVVGFRSLRAAGEELVNALHEIRDEREVRIEGSTFPGHIELTKKASVICRLDRANVQVYPIRKIRRKGEEVLVEWESELGPRLRPKLGLERALSALPESVQITAALPAWNQSWPQRDPADAMFEALASWEHVRADHSTRMPPVVSYWSWKWVARKKATTYGRDFLASAFVREAA